MQVPIDWLPFFTLDRIAIENLKSDAMALGLKFVVLSFDWFIYLGLIQVAKINPNRHVGCFNQSAAKKKTRNCDFEYACFSILAAFFGGSWIIH